MIKITNLTKIYKDNIILLDTNITLEDKKTYFVLGKNGLGKTTLIKCLLGLETYGGNITYIPEKRKTVFPVFDDMPMYPMLNGYDNIRLLTGLTYTVNQINKLQGLNAKVLKKKVGYYSLGEKKKLLMLSAMLKKPKYLILDEISNGLDIETTEWMVESINQLKRECLIVATGHDFEFYNKILDEIIVLNENKLIKVEHNGESLYDVYNQFYRNSEKGSLFSNQV